MRNFLILVLLFCLAGCWPGESYNCKGLPDVNQSFVLFHFINEHEAYLVGTLTHFEEMSEQELKNPEFIPNSVEEGTVYKTNDGGLSWVKINSHMGYYYSEAVVDADNRHLYVLQYAWKSQRPSIVSIDLKTFQETISDSFPAPISDMWMNGENLSFTTNRGNMYLYTLNPAFTMVDSTSVAEYFVKGVTSNKHCYGIIATSKNHRLYELGDEGLLSQIPLTFNPDDIAALNDSVMIIAGQNSNKVDIALYNTSTGKSTRLTSLNGYTILNDLHIQDDAITAFVGNICGMSVCYDLCYSLDAGKTWKLEKNVIHYQPSTLLGKTLYIYKGAARITKINLEDL
jgi:hypothetical protein